jgi:hypothetical protein
MQLVDSYKPENIEVNCTFKKKRKFMYAAFIKR